MPSISRFFGIVIFMNYSEHNPPHSHAKYQDQEVLIELETGISSGVMSACLGTHHGMVYPTQVGICGQLDPCVPKKTAERNISIGLSEDNHVHTYRLGKIQERISNPCSI